MIVSAELLGELTDVLARERFRRWFSASEAAAFVAALRLAATFVNDPPAEVALPAADKAAAHARDLVEALLQTSVRGDRLGQHVRNLFECLGLPEEGAAQALRCGEHPDSPLR